MELLRHSSLVSYFPVYFGSTSLVKSPLQTPCKVGLYKSLKKLHIEKQTYFAKHFYSIWQGNYLPKSLPLNINPWFSKVSFQYFNWKSKCERQEWGFQDLHFSWRMSLQSLTPDSWQYLLIPVITIKWLNRRSCSKTFFYVTWKHCHFPPVFQQPFTKRWWTGILLVQHKGAEMAYAFSLIIWLILVVKGL